MMPENEFYSVWLLGRALPHETHGLITDSKEFSAFDVLSFKGLASKKLEELKILFPHATPLEKFSTSAHIVARQHHDALVHPMEQSLASFLKCPTSALRIESWILCASPQEADRLKAPLEMLWREPAIENLWTGNLDEWKQKRLTPKVSARAADTSFDAIEDPVSIGLEFSPEEMQAIRAEEARMQRRLNRAEWELVAQTWSEHCKHKIFAADIASQDARAPLTEGLFKTHLRKPALEIQARKDSTYLSLFHDNSGVLGLT
ncbi:MAG: hypothetical protein ABIR96_02740, partial [Bdellovibrionota bacterium]